MTAYPEPSGHTIHLILDDLILYKCTCKFWLNSYMQSTLNRQVFDVFLPVPQRKTAFAYIHIHVHAPTPTCQAIRIRRSSYQTSQTHGKVNFTGAGRRTTTQRRLHFSCKSESERHAKQQCLMNPK